MEVVHLGRTCPHYRGSFSTLAAFKRLNESVRVRVKSYANVERAMCEVHSEHHSSPSHQEEEEEEDDDDDDDVDEDWPVDEDIDERWRVSASDYFKEPRIRNVVAEDGTVIDWEGDSNRGIIQEISCMEWERTVFHPSPLIVLLFERYARASTNWKVLKELEKAIQVYRKFQKLPPRTVKVDVKVEMDLASALRAKDIPQLLFIKGDKLLYRETEIRTVDELVEMIAHFYYNAKRPPFLEAEVVLRGKA
ncbi:hypothetical protein SUGI_0270220 [Cryptomeria japonica]|nr:hypothetical protein SUGI_0270220 [Cryptomeria japonica]